MREKSAQQDCDGKRHPEQRIFEKQALSGNEVDDVREKSDA
ncbi:UNVERIFIED_ORG: hypothetical protein QOE_0033 [Clostridioides difficile F501]